MKRLALIAALAFPFSAFGFNLAHAGSWSIQPGSINYNYQSTSVGVSAVVQVGGSPTVSVNQNNTYNISGVVQAGQTTSATVVQRGALNLSGIAQSGHVNTISVTQFGPTFSFLNN